MSYAALAEQAGATHCPNDVGYRPPTIGGPAPTPLLLTRGDYPPAVVFTIFARHGTMHSMVDVSGPRSALLAQMRKGALEYCVLALLRDGERYGFEIVRLLSAADGMVTSEGTIYPLLSRLHRHRLVETTWRESDSGPPRRYYCLTNTGREALDVFIEEWTRFQAGVNQLLDGRTP